MAIQTVKATIQMRRGLEQDFDADQMTSGEWAVSTDKKYVRMCFIPGLCLRMATYEAFEKDMLEIQTILATCQNIQEAVDAMANLAEQHRDNAAESAKEADNYSKLSRSYAIGTGGEIRENDDADSSKGYYEQAKRLAQGFNGIIPMGTITFADLSDLENQVPKYMFNISDAFTSDDRFKDGGGIYYGAGNNVVYTADEKWDVLASVSVTGIKGTDETTYRTGNVNLTAENVGAVSKTGDTMTGELHVNTSTGRSGLIAKRVDTGTEILCGVGQGGVNHGIYSESLAKWIAYADDKNAYFKGTADRATADSDGNNIATTYMKTSGITTKLVQFPDNKGFPNYLLMYDITTWYNSTEVNQTKLGFTGFVFSTRTIGNMQDHIAKVYIGVSYQKVNSENASNLSLRTTHRQYLPMIIHSSADDKYYLALRVIGSGRNIRFMGMLTVGYIGTWIKSTDSSGTLPDGYEIAYDCYKYTDLATNDVPGKVKPDGTTTTVDADGTIHAVKGEDLTKLEEKVDGIRILYAEAENVITGKTPSTSVTDDVYQIRVKTINSDIANNYTKNRKNGDILVVRLNENTTATNEPKICALYLWTGTAYSYYYFIHNIASSDNNAEYAYINMWKKKTLVLKVEEFAGTLYYTPVNSQLYNSSADFKNDTSEFRTFNMLGANNLYKALVGEKVAEWSVEENNGFYQTIAGLEWKIQSGTGSITLSKRVKKAGRYSVSYICAPPEGVSYIDFFVEVNGVSFSKSAKQGSGHFEIDLNSGDNLVTIDMGLSAPSSYYFIFKMPEIYESNTGLYNDLKDHAYAFASGIDTTAVPFSLEVGKAYLLFVTSRTKSSGAYYGSTVRYISTPDNENSSANVSNLTLAASTNAGFAITVANFRVDIKSDAAARTVDAALYLVSDMPDRSF